MSPYISILRLEWFQFFPKSVIKSEYKPQKYFNSSIRNKKAIYYYFQKVKESTNKIKIGKQSSTPLGFLLFLLDPAL